MGEILVPVSTSPPAGRIAKVFFFFESPPPSGLFKRHVFCTVLISARIRIKKSAQIRTVTKGSYS